MYSVLALQLHHIDTPEAEGFISENQPKSGGGHISGRGKGTVIREKLPKKGGGRGGRRPEK